MNNADEKNAARRWWYLLFVLQFVAVLWPPFFNKLEPTFIGLPFFYWYQLLWVILGAILTAIVYFVTEDCGKAAQRAKAAGGQIVKDKFSIGQYGNIALVADLDGNIIGLHSMT